ncbi:hypothetical protein OS189_17905 [Sulfitobacter sp. F26169L]|uniref:hypothetical protein n=1 Tax=Sulfitobacter sp. F26169L TaxID=2996015 RepID=UPI002260A469|nr:hypothetical protein [Sulfitobacter sp. F26169L]MCX7568220.1 hypothetical protein [Sulfitobacter sp. F26169L]
MSLFPDIAQSRPLGRISSALSAFRQTHPRSAISSARHYIIGRSIFSPNDPLKIVVIQRKKHLRVKREFMSRAHEIRAFEPAVDGRNLPFFPLPKSACKHHRLCQKGRSEVDEGKEPAQLFELAARYI